MIVRVAIPQSRHSGLLYWTYMSDGTSQSLKSHLKPIAALPRKVARAAMRVWALRGGHVAQAQRGELDAYTAEHFEADRRRGIFIRSVKRGCPRNRPLAQCDPFDVPSYYRVAVVGRAIVRGVICFDCAMSRWDAARARFRAEEGEDEPERRPHRVDLQREANEIADREWAEVTRLAGEPDGELDWYALRVLLTSVRHYLAAYADTCTDDA